jgi:hypothetical protein
MKEMGLATLVLASYKRAPGAENKNAAHIRGGFVFVENFDSEPLLCASSGFLSAFATVAFSLPGWRSSVAARRS